MRHFRLSKTSQDLQLQERSINPSTIEKTTSGRVCATASNCCRGPWDSRKRGRSFCRAHVYSENLRASIPGSPQQPYLMSRIDQVAPAKCDGFVRSKMRNIDYSYYSVFLQSTFISSSYLVVLTTSLSSHNACKSLVVLLPPFNCFYIAILFRLNVAILSGIRLRNPENKKQLEFLWIVEQYVPFRIIFSSKGLQRLLHSQKTPLLTFVNAKGALSENNIRPTLGTKLYLQKLLFSLFLQDVGMRGTSSCALVDLHFSF